MEKLIEMILHEHPKFAQEIKGCTEEEIQLLEKYNVYGHMPDEYKIFLRYMGIKSGPVVGWHRKWDKLKEFKETNNPRAEILIHYPKIFDFFKKMHKEETKHSNLRFTHQFFEMHNKKLTDYFLFGIDQYGNDNGHYWLDLTSPDLSVVEISETLPFILRSESFRAFLFEIPFGRTLNKFEYSKKWL